MRAAVCNAARPTRSRVVFFVLSFFYIKACNVSKK